MIVHVKYSTPLDLDATCDELLLAYQSTRKNKDGKELWLRLMPVYANYEPNQMSVKRDVLLATMKDLKEVPSFSVILMYPRATFDTHTTK